MLEPAGGGVTTTALPFPPPLCGRHGATTTVRAALPGGTTTCEWTSLTLGLLPLLPLPAAIRVPILSTKAADGRLTVPLDPTPPIGLQRGTRTTRVPGARENATTVEPTVLAWRGRYAA